ncbi:hypothetical protein FoTM2_009426 [Fusarium oxysporum f. sp. vasinfectum]|nr:hypothetical protein FoTM2_009426 [Fusarium oxysporum f. sp. vasinfectum]
MIRFRFYAQHILKHNGSTHTLGKNWHSSFFKRRPALKCLKSKLIDYKRVDGANTANINLFFDRFDTPEVQHIPLRHTYNADDFGLMEAAGDNGMVVGESYRNWLAGQWNFPRNRSKPLNSRFVRRGDPDATYAPTSAFPTPPAPDFAQKMSAVDVQTPKSSRDLVKLKRSLMAVDPAFGQSAARLLFRKVGKALDDNIVKLTAAEVQTDHLTNALEKARPQKRRRVIPDPNKDFVELHEVQTEKARLAAEGGGESDIHSDLEGSTLSNSGSEKSSEAEDCIKVRNIDFEST